MDLLLDISRTVSRARLAQPTGIDRVEREYIDWALARDARFVCVVSGMRYVLEAAPLRGFLAWMDGEGPPPPLDLKAQFKVGRDVRLRRAHAFVRRHGAAIRHGAPSPRAPGAVYLNVGHDNLDTPWFDALALAGWCRGVMIHDVIPLDFPEYCRPQTPEVFSEKLKAVQQAQLVLCNSEDTRTRLLAHMPDPRAVSIVAPLGISPASPQPAQNPTSFLALGTIEPRKNHAMLLDLWGKRWAAQTPLPPLHLIGRRGWLNAEVFHVLDTHPMMGTGVLEHGPLDDAALGTTLSQTIALLFPSWAEGYGLPLAEALAAGVPVIAADLPALREVGGDVPDWVAPGDRAGWAAAIDDYATPGSKRRAAQLYRMSGWQAPTWERHFQIVEKHLETILVQGHTAR